MKKHSKSKKKQLSLFEKSATRRRGLCLLDAPLDNSKISLYEEAENTWKLGKKLDHYAENDDDIVESLVWNAKASIKEPLNNKANDKRGIRKSKRKKSAQNGELSGLSEFFVRFSVEYLV